MSRRRWSRCPPFTTALAAAAFLVPRSLAWAEGESPQPSSCEENVQRLQADGAERLRQIEALRAVLAASEKAWNETQVLLESMRKQLREELAARQASEARKDKQLTDAGEALNAATAAEARQSARVAELDRTVAELRRQVDLQRAERLKLASELSSLRKAQDEAAQSQAAELAARDAEAKQLGERLTQAERERASALAALQQRPSQDRVVALEAQLTAVREREQKSRASAQELEETLVQERQVSQSKLEALQSVLKNTRSAGADLRTKLDDTRDKNAALSRQVTELKTAVGKVHELQTSFQQKSFRLEELAQTKDADAGEIRNLQSQRSSLAGEIRRARSEQVASAASVSRWMKAEELPLAPLPPAAGGAAEDDRADGDLREQLSLERERRETLEEEVKRLTTSGNSEEKFVEVWNTLQSARSQILVLTNQLADERQSRETLEIALTRMKEASGEEGQSTAEFATRLAETLKERRDEANRLADQLKSANEVIVRLKGRLEAAGSPTADGSVMADVDQENQKLREALRTAEEANRSLREKAEMAARLAEMVYGKAR
jgi:DNA repair exonuclease SbcCD ATPase subunit